MPLPGAENPPRWCNIVGAYSSEALGDYCAGPNHVLPTAHGALSSPLGVYDFQKRSSIIKCRPPPPGARRNRHNPGARRRPGSPRTLG